MIIKFTKDTEVEGRLYLAGQSHEFSRETAERLIDGGAAFDPGAVVPDDAPKEKHAPKAKK